MERSTRSRGGDAQVRLVVFDNEPLARLWEQRLWQEGVPCVVRPVGVGASLGSTTHVPHGLYVQQRDIARAREALAQDVDLPPLEVLERQRPRPLPGWVLVALALAVLGLLGLGLFRAVMLGFS